MLSYRLLWFEDDDPAEWPDDLDGGHHHPRPAHRGGAVDRATTSSSSGSRAPAPRRSWSAGGRRCSRTCPGWTTTPPPRRRWSRHTELLARAPSTLLSATLDDAVGEVRRPNMPGAADRPNWSLPLPVAVEDLPAHPLLQKVARTLAEGVAGA